MKRTLSLVALALAAATAIACGAGGTTTTGSGGSGAAVSAAPAPSPKVYRLGETVTVKEEFLDNVSEYTLVVKDAKTFTKEPGSFGSKPSKGEFVVLTVAVNVTRTDDTVFVMDSDFKFIGADGTAYTTTFQMGFGDGLSAAELRGGQKSAGKLVFDLPKGAWKTGKLQYAASFLDANVTCVWALA